MIAPYLYLGVSICVLFEMIALMGEFGVIFSGYNFYLFLFFMTAAHLFLRHL